MGFEGSHEAEGEQEAGAVGALLDFSFMFMEDLDSGKVRPVEYYQERFPGYEGEIESEYGVIRNEIDGEQEEPAPHDTSDTKIGSYEIERELGRGGQATVYVARDTRMDRSVALKVLSSTLGRISPESMERFRREADSVANIDHPCICDVFEADFESDSPYIAMRLVKGESIRQHIQRAMLIEAGELEGETDDHMPCYPKSEEELFTILRAFERLARALHAAHEGGVIHRDIKPANLIVDDSGTPIILDFGLARVGGEEGSDLTMTGQIFGTPAFMPPELLRGQVDDPGPTLDVYALAVTLYECLTLKRPFDATTPEALYNQILEQDAPSARVYHPELPKELAVVLGTALEKDLNRRYGSALDLAEELRRICEREPILAIPAGPALRLKRWLQRHPALGLSIAASVLFLVCGLTISLVLLRKVTTERDLKEELLVEVVTERDRKEELLVEVAEERDQKEQVLEIYKATYYRENARAALKPDPLYATLLASEAYRREPTELNHREMRIAMSQTFDERRTRVPFQNFKGDSGFISSRVMNPTTRQFIYVDRTDNLWAYDYSKEEATRVLEGPISDDLDEATKSEMASKASPSMELFMGAAGDALFVTRRLGEVVEVRSPDAQELRAELAVDGEKLLLWSSSPGRALSACPPLEGERFRAGPVRLWDTSSGELISELPFEGMYVMWAELSPTGEHVAVSLYPKDPSGAERARVEIWDRRMAELVRELCAPVVSLMGKWGPRGDRLYTGSLIASDDPESQPVWQPELWSLPDGEQLRRLDFDDPCDNVAFSSDGEYFATTHYGDGLVKVWSGRTGEAMHELEGHDARDFVGIHFSQTDPELLATTSVDQSTRIWDVSKGEQVNLFVGMSSRPGLDGACGWDGDSYYVLSEKGVLHAWRAGPPVWPKKITATDEDIVAAWFDADGDALIIERYTEGERHTGGIERVNWRTGEVLASHQWAKESVNSEVVDCVRKTVSGKSNGYRGDANGSLEVVEWNWETDTERVVATTEGPIKSISLSMEGDPRNVLLMSNQALEVWDFERAEQLYVVDPSDSSAQWIMSEWGPETGLLATAAADGFVRLWDGESGELIRELGPFTAHNDDSQILDLLFSPNEDSIYAACKDARIREWDVETGELLLEKPSHTMSSLKLVGQDQLLGNALYNGKMVLFDRSSELENSVQLNLGTKPASWVDVSPDKRHVLISNTLSPAALLDMSRYKAGADLKERVQVGSFSSSLEPSEATESTFEITEFSPDGEHLMAVHEGVVWIWPADLLSAAEEMSPVEIDYFGGLPSPSLTEAHDK